MNCYIVLIYFLIFFLFTTGDIANTKPREDNAVVSHGTKYEVITREKIYICAGYFEDTGSFCQQILHFLKTKQAQPQDGYWLLKNHSGQKIYEIRIIQDIDGVRKALQEEGTHVIIRGHANYGLGPIFLKPEDERVPINGRSVLDWVQYIDDERILQISSKWIAVPVAGMRKNNRLTNWWPIYRNGASGIAPYRWAGDGDLLAYNYYLTYQRPGDSYHHIIYDDDNNPIERFPLSGKEPWFSTKGDKPDPLNPNHKKYFITTDQTAHNKTEFKTTGTWYSSREPSGYYNEDFIISPKGTGAKSATWYFRIHQKGRYIVSSWTPCPKDKFGGDVQYFVDDLSINSNVLSTNIEKNGNHDEGLCSQWRKIGSVDLSPGDHCVTMMPKNGNDAAIADAIRISHADNPPCNVIPFFFVPNRLVKTRNVVTFKSKSKGNIKYLVWDFGDGTVVKLFKSHAYHRYKKPGVYTVSLAAVGYDANQSLKKTKRRYVYVDVKSDQSLSDFTASPNTGNVPLSVRFIDRSIGKIKEWYWDFGDGHSSRMRNPTHTYIASGVYNVTLTTTDEHGQMKKHIKKEYVTTSIYNKVIDNIIYPLPHYHKSTLVKTNNDTSLRTEKFSYKRLFFDSCNVKQYFLENLTKGKVFYTKKVSNGEGLFLYLNHYIQGYSDEYILKELNSLYPSTYEFFDFDKKSSVK